MILVVGGIASGKRTYIESLGFGRQDFCEGALGDGDVLYGLEELLHAGPLSQADFEAICAKDVVACAEVGSGVVPLDEGQRAWRERVGRVLGMLSPRAAKVVRMVCGIPVVLKG